MSIPSSREKSAVFALFAQGRLEEAAQFAAGLAQRYPHHGFGWNALGGALGRLGRAAEALAPLRRAAELMPGDATVLNNLGAAYLSLGQSEESRACFERALQLKPLHADANSNLGIVLRRQGRPAEAVACFQRLLRAVPEHAEAHCNLGLALIDLTRFDEAQACFQRALELKPKFAEAHHNLGTALQHRGRFIDAESSFRHALNIAPDYADAYASLGVALQQLGRMEEAVASCRQALTLKPESTEARSVLLFCLNYMDGASTASLEEAYRYGEVVAATVPRRFAEWNCPTSADRLKVGFVSGDLREHPVGHFLENLLANLDPSRIELIAYPTGHQVDHVTSRLQHNFAAWRPLAGLSDEAAARLIHDDGVHILCDLAGHTADNRLPLFAWKPAPIQVSWLGYFATTGVAEIDYFIADPWTCPPGDEVQYTEKIYRLAQTRLCFLAPRVDLSVSALPAAHNNYVTFCCFNNLSKMNASVVAVWARILVTMPDSRLLLKAGQLADPRVRRAVVEQFACCGVPADRLILEGPSPRAQYLAEYQRADLALDPFPFSGATTTVESLWMGVPVLTLQGDRLVSRQGVGLLRNANLPDWIATDPDDYVARAVRHAGDWERLGALRKRLRQQVLQSPVFDGRHFARQFETALWEMWAWRNRCHAPPMHI